MTNAERELLLLLGRVVMKEGSPFGVFFGSTITTDSYRSEIQRLVEQVLAEYRLKTPENK